MTSTLDRSPTDHATQDPPPPDRRTATAVMAVFVVLAVLTTVFGGDLLRRPPSTSDGDWSGETIELVIPLAEGGGTDTWGRFVGQALARAVPGTPGFAPVNDAGGEGIVGTNRFAATADADGTEVLVSTWNAVQGRLGELQQSVLGLVRALGEEEQKARLALDRLEASLVHQLREWDR